MNLLMKAEKDPNFLSDFLKEQKRTIKALTGLTEEEIDEMELKGRQKINEFLLDRVTGALGFTKLSQNQQNSSEGAKAE